MHPHVDALRARVADRHDLALLEEAQQLGLHVDRQVADFVEEERAAGRGADEARLVRARAPVNEPAAMAEQLTVGELARGRRAVVGQEDGARCASEPTWMARATSSLPVPLSPVMSTVRSLPCRR